MRLLAPLFFLALFLSLLFFLLALWRFDASTLRPALQQVLSADLGARAELGPVSLRWGRKLFIEAEDFRLFSPQSGELLVKSDHASLAVTLVSLLRPQASIESVRLGHADIRFPFSLWQEWQWLFSPREPRVHGNDLPAFGLPSLLRPAESQSWEPFIPVFLVHNARIHCSPEEPAVSEALCFEQAELLWTTDPRTGRWQLDAHGEIPDGEDGWFLTGVYDPAEDVFHLKTSNRDEKWMFEGMLSALRSGGALEGILDVSGQDVREIFRAAGIPQDILSGRLTAQFRAAVRNWIRREELMLRGPVDIREGRFLNVHFAAQALERILEAFPQLAGTAGGAPAFDWLAAGDTPFEILQADLELMDESIRFYEARAKHQAYLMEISGEQGLRSREVDFAGKIVFLEHFSRQLTAHYPGLRALFNPQGRIVIPFRYSGLFPNAVVRPDLDYLYAVLQAAVPGSGGPGIEVEEAQDHEKRDVVAVEPAEAARGAGMEASAAPEEDATDWFQILEQL